MDTILLPDNREIRCDVRNERFVQITHFLSPDGYRHIFEGEIELDGKTVKVTRFVKFDLTASAAPAYESPWKVA